jgi:hypothetical protein
LREFGDMSSKADRNSNQEHVQQEQGVHGEAADRHGHSGEGAASAMAHMIQQDQKQRGQGAESRQESRDG